MVLKIKTYKKIKLLVLQEFSCVYTGQNLSMDSLLNISFCSLFSTPIKSSKYFSTANSSKNCLGSNKASFSSYFLKIILTFALVNLDSTSFLCSFQVSIKHTDIIKNNVYLDREILSKSHKNC